MIGYQKLGFGGAKSYTWIFDCEGLVPLMTSLFKGQLSFAKQ